MKLEIRQKLALRKEKKVSEETEDWNSVYGVKLTSLSVIIRPHRSTMYLCCAVADVL